MVRIDFGSFTAKTAAFALLQTIDWIHLLCPITKLALLPAPLVRAARVTVPRQRGLQAARITDHSVE